MPAWRIYYADGSTFDSDDGSPNDARPVGVLVIMQRDLAPPYTPEQLKGENYYYWGGPTMQWRGSCRDALIEALLERDPIEGLLQGRRVSRVDFYAAKAEAMNDPDFQP